MNRIATIVLITVFAAGIVFKLVEYRNNQIKQQLIKFYETEYGVKLTCADIYTDNCKK